MQKNVFNSVGKLPIDEDEILKSKYSRPKAFALKRELTKVSVSSRTNTIDREMELDEFEQTVVED
jgi:hypothetical protein